MQSKILANKKLVTDKTNEVFVDLTTRSMDYKSEGTTIDAFYVGDDMAMRIDLISYAAYGNDDHFDIICKYNSISNPFAVDAFDLIYIPDLGFMYDSLEDPTKINAAEEVRNQYTDESKKSKLDPKQIEYDSDMRELRKNTTGGAFSKFNLPPNMSEPGDKEGRVNSQGLFVLGGDVTKNQ